MEQRRISRSNAGWRANVGTLKDGTVEFQMVYDTADTDFDALQSAFLNNTTIEFTRSRLATSALRATKACARR